MALLLDKPELGLSCQWLAKLGLLLVGVSEKGYTARCYRPISPLLSFASTALSAAALWPGAPKCGTCNPISGENHCDATTSCINTGSRFHCACRAGYKASPYNHDISKQFRLPMPDYEFLVFTPEWTTCDTRCDNPYGASKELCAEVPVIEKCEI